MATVMEAEVNKSTGDTSSVATTKAKKKAATVALATDPAAATDQAKVESPAGAVSKEKPAQPKPKFGKRTIAATQRVIITKARKTVAQSKEELARLKIIEEAIGQKCETIRTTLAKGDASHFEAGDQINELLGTLNPDTKEKFTIRQIALVLGRWTPSFICKLSVVAKECDPQLRKKLASAGITWNDAYEVCRMRRRYELEETFEVSMAQYLRMKGISAYERCKQEVEPFATDECVRDLIERKRASEPPQGAVADRPFKPDEYQKQTWSLFKTVEQACEYKGNGNYLALVVVPDVKSGNVNPQLRTAAESPEVKDAFFVGALLALLGRIPADSIEPIIAKVKSRMRELSEAQVPANNLEKQVEDEPRRIINRLSRPWEENIKTAEELMKKLWSERTNNKKNSEPAQPKAAESEQTSSC